MTSVFLLAAVAAQSSDPKLVSAGIFPAVVLTRAQAVHKTPARVSITPPRITPARSSQLFSLSYHPEASGVVVFGKKNRSGYWDLDQHLALSPTWIAGDYSVKLDQHGGGVFYCPYVYGNKAVEVSLKPHRDKPDVVRVSLPPNKVPAPRLPAAQVSLGPVRLSLTPLPPLSPSFPLPYQIRVEGGAANKLYLVGFHERKLRNYHFSVLVPASGYRMMNIYEWKTDLVLHGQVIEVAKVGLQATAKRTSSAPDKGHLKIVRDSDGLVLLDYVWRGNGSSGGSGAPGGYEYFVLKGMQLHSHHPDILQLGGTISQPSNTERLFRLKDGEWLSGYGFRAVRTYDFKVEMKLPVPPTARIGAGF